MTRSGWLGELVDLLLPGRCAGCGDRLPLEAGPGHLVCTSCRARLRAPPSPRCRRCDFPLGTGRSPAEGCLACRSWPAIVTDARTAVLLEAPADALVYALKYQGWRGLARTMGARMARAVPPPKVPGSAPVVVPVPTTPRRLRRRGYNQADLLAGAYATGVGLPRERVLLRREGGGTQVSLAPAQRAANVAGAFRLSGSGEGARIRGRHVLLVDDVLTTGATVSAAAAALERGGASGVSVIAFARAVPRRA